MHMRDTGTGHDRETEVGDRESEVWDRAAGGEPASDLQGDRALADALRFLGHAEGDGVLSAVELEVEAEDTPPTASAALGWFGLGDAAGLVSEVERRWIEIVDGALDEAARVSALGELEAEADRRLAALEVSDRLQEALRTALRHRPECFADEVAPRPTLPTGGPPERPGWAVRIPPEEKLRRTVLAYEAFGVRAEVEDGHLTLWPPDTDAGWEMLDEIDQLLEHRYPTEED
jgi:hypothetical protein